MNDTQKPLLQAGKWLYLPVLLDADEMAQMIQDLSPFLIFITGALVKPGDESVSVSRFLHVYQEYIGTLKEGRLPQESHYRQLFSTLWTRTADAVLSSQVSPSEQIVRPVDPVIQLRPHRLSYSPIDGEFRSMVFGASSITWGIQFAYPQIVQHPDTQEVESVTETPRFPNTQLFRSLQRWVRHHTLPTPFLAEDKRINVPVRLGKRCTHWINRHPQLIEQQLSIFMRGEHS